MCGRFALHSGFDRLAVFLDLPVAEHAVTARYNVSPGTWIAAVRRRTDDADGRLALDTLWWGYRPHWADDKAPQPINATAEKVASSRYFRDAFARRRCLVPADGWYEWRSVDGIKQPYYFTRLDADLLWLAGVWTERADGKAGCAILTEPARGLAAEIHPRMPLILAPDSLAPWLDPTLTDPAALRRAVRHLDAQALTRWPVSTRVNKPSEDDAALIEREPAA